MSNTIQLQIQLDAKNAAYVVQELTTKVSNLGGSVNTAQSSFVRFDDKLANVGLRISGLTSLWNIFQGTFGSWIAESNAGEAAVAKLTQALQTQAVYTEALVKDIQKYASVRQTLTGIDDDATVAIAAQFTAMGLQGKALREAIDSAQDLSAVMGTDLTNAARLVGNAMKDGGEELKRYGFNLSDIRGQAEAIGNTGVGGMKKFDAALADIKQSFGDLLKEALVPMLNVINPILAWFNNLPNAAKIAGMSVVVLGTAFAFLNSKFGATPYIALVLTQSIVALMDAIHNGNPIVAGIAAMIGSVAVALIAMNLQTTLVSIGLVSKLIPSLVITNSMLGLVNFETGKVIISMTLLQASILGIVGIVAAAGVALYMYFRNQGEEAGKAINNINVSYKNMTKEIIADIDALPMLEDKLKLTDGYIANVEASIKKLWNAVIEAQNSGKSDDEIAKLKTQLANERKLLSELSDHKKQLQDDEVKDRAAVDADLRKMRAQRITDETAKAKEQAAIEFEEEKKKNADKAKSKRQLDLLNEESEKNYNAKIKAINDKTAQQKLDAENEVQAKTIALMQDGYAKRAAMAELDFKKEIENLNRRKTAREISEQQYTELVKLEQSKRDDILYPKVSRLKIKSGNEIEREKTDKEKEELKKRIDQTKDAFKSIESAELEKAESSTELSKQQMFADAEAAKAKQDATEQEILAGEQAYDANKIFGVQLNQLVNQRIKAYIGEAIAAQLKWVFASIPFPFNIVAAPAAGLAVQALLEKFIPKFATGGVVPGVGDSDNVLALLTPGERVMRKSVSQTHAAFLDALNAGVAVPMQQIIVQQPSTDSGLVASLSKEIKNLSKKMKQQIFIQSNFDVQNYEQANKKMQRTRAAFAL